jgi:hypothetical protein
MSEETTQAPEVEPACLAHSSCLEKSSSDQETVDGHLESTLNSGGLTSTDAGDAERSIQEQQLQPEALPEEPIVLSTSTSNSQAHPVSQTSGESPMPYDHWQYEQPPSDAYGSAAPLAGSDGGLTAYDHWQYEHPPLEVYGSATPPLVGSDGVLMAYDHWQYEQPPLDAYGSAAPLVGSDGGLMAYDHWQYEQPPLDAYGYATLPAGSDGGLMAYDHWQYEQPPLEAHGSAVSLSETTHWPGEGGQLAHL